MNTETTLPDLVSQQGFEVASQLASKKEQAIIKALDHTFGEGQWDESSVAGKVRLRIDLDGTEIFMINGQPILTFGILETDVMISGKSIILLFQQPIYRKY